jgi:hypothetical protein
MTVKEEWLYTHSCLKEAWLAITRTLCTQVNEYEVACLEQARVKIEEALTSIKHRKPELL